MKKLATLLLLICAVSAQTKLTPTEIETLKLAKLKAQLATLGQSVETVKVQIQLYQAQQYFLDQQKNNKQTELDKLAEEIKQAHKDWGKMEDIIYNLQDGESGSFSKKVEEKKDEKK